MPSPRVFLSYDHGDVGLRDIALGLANELRRGGIDAWVDLYEPAPIEGTPQWREQQLVRARFVLVLCTPEYRRHFEAQGTASEGQQVRWEALFVRQRLHDDPGFRARVLPVVPPGGCDTDIPTALRSASPCILPSGYDDLYRRLTGQPKIVRPALGALRRRVDNLGPRPPVFEGRSGDLAQIQRAFAGSDTAAVYPVITGLGGMGKTRLALEHAYLGEFEYDVRWRVRAGVLANFQEDLVELGRRLGILGDVENIERAVVEVQAWLSTHKRWLVVFDNAENPRSLRTLLPSPSPGHVLITSRARAWRGVAKPVEIDQLSPEAARAVLLHRSGQSDDGYADALAGQLGYLPLALVQAGAFMEATGCSFRGYLNRLEQLGLAMFRDAKASTGDYYEQTVAVTWEVSLTAIHNQNPHAQTLLRWLAFLDPDGVPLRSLRAHPEGLPPEIAECVSSVALLDDAVAVLRRFSMVDRIGEPEEGLRIHRLVQVVTREALGEQAKQMLSAIIEWLDGAFAYEPRETPVSQVVEGIAEQLMAVASLETDCSPREYRLTSILNALGDYWLRRGQLAVARTASQRSLDVAERLTKTEPSSIKAQRALAVSLERLGEVEVQAGNLAAASNLFQRDLDIAEGLAKAAPGNARAQRDLSVSLNKLGELEMQAANLTAARKLFQRSLLLREQLTQANPGCSQAQRDLSVSLERLGEVEVQAGNLAVARDCLQRYLGIAEGLAQADTRSARAQRDLSLSLGKLGEMELKAGDLPAARDLFQRYLDIAEHLAETDPDSAQAQRDLSVSQGKLGEMEVRAGNLAVARELFQRSLCLRDTLAKANPDSAQAAFDVATSRQWLAHLAEQGGNRDNQLAHLRAAKRILDTMEANGQFRGYASFERARQYVDSRLP